MRAGYDGLVVLAERELDLVRSGTFEALQELWDQRKRLVSELPAIPPAEARPCLERAAELQGRTTALLEERLAATGAELRRLVRGRAAVNGYAPHIERVPLVDRAG